MKHSIVRGAPLVSWNEGPSKASILQFVERVTAEGGVDHVPALDRIAVFVNDGTLWPEKPFYFQLAFALDRVKALAAQHPGWQEQPPFKAVLEDDLESVLSGGLKAIIDILVTTHGGNGSNEFEKIVSGWITSARHS